MVVMMMMFLWTICFLGVVFCFGRTFCGDDFSSQLRTAEEEEEKVFLGRSWRLMMAHRYCTYLQAWSSSKVGVVVGWDSIFHP